jgi:ABC-2 type transport system ATP-binding protein
MQSMIELLQPAVDVRDLRKTYVGGVEAVKGVSFKVGAGEAFGLLGPNGAGKSTTIGMLSTTIVPTGGTARLAGFDVAREPLSARAVSSVVFQEPVVDRDLTGRANLELHARLWGIQAPQIREVAGALGVAELLERRVASYSGGERRRLEIARALVSEPRVLFLDEPTVGLDPRIRHELLDAIAALRDSERMSIVLTTHYLDEAQRLCDRVAIMHGGEIVALDTPDALTAGLGREVVELHVGGDLAEALAALRMRGIASDGAFAVGSTLTLPLHDVTVADVLAALAGHAVGVISTRQPNLDDVYLRLTGETVAAAA